MAKLLTEKEQELLTEYFRCGNQVKAYKKVYPEKSDTHAYAHASAKIKKIKEKLTQQELMEFANLGLGRFIAKLEELLECEQHFYNKDGVHVGQHPDNKTRFQATQLLGKMLGLTEQNDGNENNETEETVNEIEITDTVDSVGVEETTDES
ncbi:MAG: terminase small subunit [Treponema sp.]|nr:terminase small subunit [Treponema sp.]